MKDCLVTTLKKSVNNSSLPKLGMFRIETFANPSGSSYGAIWIEQGKTLRVHYVNKETGETTGSYNWVGDGNVKYFNLADRYIDFENYYVIRELQPSQYVTFDVALLAYSTSTTLNELAQETIGLRRGIRGDIASLGGLIRLTSMNILNAAVKGSLNELAEKMVANGRTSGSLSIYKRGVLNLYLDGVKLSEDTDIRITFDSSVEGGYTTSVIS